MHIINITHKYNNMHIFTYLAPQISHKCSANNIPVPLSSNVVTMDLSLLLGMYAYCMYAYVVITLCLQYNTYFNAMLYTQTSVLKGTIILKM